MDNLLQSSIDDPYYVIKLFFNELYDNKYSPYNFLDGIFYLTKKIDVLYEGVGLSFADYNDRPLVDVVNFYEGFDQNFQPATEISVPFETYKQFTLEAIDAYQQRHYHKGLAKARRQFLPKDIGLDHENNLGITDAENETFDVPMIHFERTLFGAVYDKNTPIWSLFYYLNMIYNKGCFINAIEQFTNKQSHSTGSAGETIMMRIGFKDRDFQQSTKTAMLALGSYLDYVIFIPFEEFSTIVLEAIDIYQSKHYKKTLALYRQKLVQMDNETPPTYNNQAYERYGLKDDDYE